MSRRTRRSRRRRIRTRGQMSPSLTLTTPSTMTRMTILTGHTDTIRSVDSRWVTSRSTMLRASRSR